MNELTILGGQETGSASHALQHGPLSSGQLELWMMDGILKNRSANNLISLVQIDSHIQPHYIEQLLVKLLTQQAAWRSYFVEEEGKTSQVVHPIADPHFSFIDCQHMEGFSFEHWLAETSESPFDLSQNVFRSYYLAHCPFKPDATPIHLLVIMVHHIAADFASVGLYVSELNRLHKAQTDEKNTKPVLQYLDYVKQEQALLQGPNGQTLRDYWAEQLRHAVPQDTLPLDRSREGENAQRSVSAHFPIPFHLCEGMRILGRTHSATPFIAMLSAYFIFLHRYTHSDDLLAGTPISIKPKDFHNVIGYFVNLLPLRVAFEPSDAFANVITRVKGVVEGAVKHKHLPFGEILRSAGLKVPKGGALFQTAFAWERSKPTKGKPAEETDALVIETIASYQSGTQNDLLLSVYDDSHDMFMIWNYNAELFEAGTIDRMAANFLQLLEGLVANPLCPILDLPLVNERENALVTREFNVSAAPLSDEHMHTLFEKRVPQHPEATAVICGAETITYDALNRWTNRLAHRLRMLGVGPHQRVAVCMEKCLEGVVALMAILKAGGAYVPLDPAYPLDRLRHMLTDSQAVAVITKNGLFQAMGILEAGDATTALPDALPILDLTDRVEAEPDHNISPQETGLTIDTLAYVIYTSGSTGMPKGVMIDHRGAVNTLLDIRDRFQVTPDANVLAVSSFSFDLSVFDIFGTLGIGGTLVIPPSTPTGAADPIQWQEIIRETGITLWNSAPPLMQLFMDAAMQGQVEPFPSVKLVMLSGDWIPLKLPSHIRKYFPNATLYSLGGATEASIWSVYYPIGEVDPAWRSIPYGKPLGNQTTYVLDKQGHPCPIGVSGELHIGGIGVAMGYQNRPELSAQKFIPDPFSPHGRLYMTGDLCRWRSDGNLEILGRNDFQVKIRGYRIELGEIESRLAEHPALQEAIVIAREDVPGNKRLVAYFISSEKLSFEVLRDHLATRVPDYMVPTAFVQLTALPLTPNGKLDRKALPVPEGDAYAAKEYVAPETDVEKRLADIWASVLGRSPIGRNDNFFELGGHSLMTVTLIEKMREANLHADIRAIFASPTLAGLAALTETTSQAVVVPPNLIPPHCQHITPDMLPLVALTEQEIATIVDAIPGGAENIQDIYPLAPLQEGILFHHITSSESDAFLLSGILAVESRRRLESFIEGVQAVINRHDALRTAVLWEGLSEPVQVVHRQVALVRKEIKVPAGQSALIALKAHFDMHTYRMDVRQAPLLHLGIAEDKAEQRWLVCIILHHLVGDHTTLEVMQEEVQSYFDGHASLLPPAAPFRNLVAQARLGVPKEEQEAFFREMLEDVTEPTAPFGILDAQRDGRGALEHHMPLTEALASGLREQARNLGVSAASLCHHAWAQVLSALTGREDVVFGTMLFGRMQGAQGVGRAMGVFVNTLPLRVHVGPDSAAKSVRKIHHQLADLMRHEHASLALAQRCSGVKAPLPLFTAPLNYRHTPTADLGDLHRFCDGVTTLQMMERGNYPLSMDVDDFGAGFILTAQVMDGLDPVRLCDFMRHALGTLVGALAHNTENPVRQWSPLPANEYQQVIHQWNATKQAFPGQPRLAHVIFERQATERPDAIALVQGTQSITYGELNVRSNRLAHRLRELGVKPDGCVALCIEKSIDMMVGMLAVLKAGSAYVPMDPEYPEDRLLQMVKDSTPLAILASTAQQEHLGRLLAERLVLVPLLGVSEPYLEQPTTNPDPDAIGLTEDHLAYVCFTSGSTGVPKGVMIDHHALWNLSHANQRIYNIVPTDRILQFIPYHFDGSLEEIFGAFQVGATLVLREADWALSATHFWQKVAAHHITLVDLPTRFWQALAMETQVLLPPCLKKIIIYGEAVEERALRLWFNRRESLPRLFNTYGPTETTVNATIRELTPDDTHWKSLGAPIANVQLYVLNEHQQPAPAGTPGELYIGGAGVGRGYLNRPDLTAEKFVPNPFHQEAPQHTSARLYRTGDLVRWLPDGTIEFLGRNDFQVKIRGFRIELGEIEARLQEYPGIREAAVVVREDVPGEKRLIAYFSSDPEQSIYVDLVREHLLLTLPEFMVPVAFVPLDALPLTANGKLDRKALPAPEGPIFHSKDYVEPEGPVEIALAAIWKDILKVEKVGRFDNFFELGGHSLLAMNLMERMRQQNIPVDVRVIFDSPTLADIAAVRTSHRQVVVPENLLMASTHHNGEEDAIDIEI